MKVLFILVSLFLSNCGESPLYNHKKVIAPPRPWDHGIIPYKISKDISNFQKRLIRRGMDAWEREAAVLFVEREDEINYVEIIPSEMCASSVGKQGGLQHIYLAPQCGYSTILHELGHTLGLMHEHQRFLRDDYVKINWENIIAGQERNFYKISKALYPLDGPYDYSSVMHYSEISFTNDFPEKTLEILPSSLEEEQDPIVGGWRISPLDALKVQTLYENENGKEIEDENYFEKSSETVLFN